MKSRILIYLGILCFLVLASAGCIGRQERPLGFSGVTAYDGILYLSSTDGKVMAVNTSARNEGLPFPSSSSEEWSFPITGPSEGASCGGSSGPVSIYSVPVIVNGLVCIGTYSGEVLMMSPSARGGNLDFPQMRSGEWTYPTTGEVIGPIVGNPVTTDDTIYVCSSDGRVHALDATYGDQRWKSEPLGSKLWITPVVEEETVYVSTLEGYIYALSAKDGSLLPWNFKAEAGFVSSPMLHEKTILVGSFDYNLYAVSVGASKPLWEFPGNNWFWATPVIRDGVVYAGCLDGKVYAIDSKTGNELWPKPFDTENPVVSSPALAHDFLVVASEAGDVYALDFASGNPINKVSIDATIQGALCVLDHMVYIRAQNNCLYAIDIVKGEINWEFPLTTE